MKTLVLNFSAKAYECYCPEKTDSFHNTLSSLITYKAFWDHSPEKGMCVCVCVSPSLQSDMPLKSHDWSMETAQITSWKSDRYWPTEAGTKSALGLEERWAYLS